jgi:hypothetical protein
MEVLIDKLEQAFQLTGDLVEGLEATQLSLGLGDLPSNRIGEQLWCVVGARESYFKAIQKSEWAGFNCSLINVASKPEIIERLQATQLEIISFLRGKTLTEKQTDLVIDLLTHEIQHHGQLIRYLYGNGIKFPKSWRQKYSV